jgi:hypothetical protein
VADPIDAGHHLQRRLVLGGEADAADGGRRGIPPTSARLVDQADGQRAVRAVCLAGVVAEQQLVPGAVDERAGAALSR